VPATSCPVIPTYWEILDAALLRKHQ
jgi:hypothetical protein